MARLNRRPAYTLRYWERKNLHIRIEPDGAEILRLGTADYIGFSYYMSNAVKADAKTDTGTGKRYCKKSFHWYKNVIATNGEEL